MDPGKLIEALQAAGPGAGIGLAAGLLFFILGLPVKKWVLYGQYEDMKAQRDDMQKRLDKAEADYRVELAEVKTELRATQNALDRTQIMVAAGVAISRKNAHLASSIMGRTLDSGADHE